MEERITSMVSGNDIANVNMNLIRSLIVVNLMKVGEIRGNVMCSTCVGEPLRSGQEFDVIGKRQGSYWVNSVGNKLKSDGQCHWKFETFGDDLETAMLVHLVNNSVNCRSDHLCHPVLY